MMWELMGHIGCTQDRHLQFPTGKDRQSFEASCKGIIRPLDQRAVDLLREREAFPGGNGDLLYVLGQLDNADKHTAIPTVVRASKISKLKIVDGRGNLRLELVNCAVGGGSGPFATITNVPRGCSVELDNDAKATPEIFFAHEIAAGWALFPALKQMSHTTANAVGVIAKAMS